MPNRKILLAIGALAILLITVLQLPSLALAQDEPSESTDSSDLSDPELDGDPEERASDDGESAGGRSRDIQEVIHVEGVRTSGLKEVPISVTAFGASDIQNLRIQNVADLAAYTPNLEINTSFAASNPTLFIRGVGLKDYNSNSTGAVSIHQDGIHMNSPAAQLFSLYDIEGIEVLRGPVGGLGGRNASAGQIRIHSFRPNGEWTSEGSFSAGNLNLLQFEGALGMPIFPELFNDTLSARFSVVTEFRDGYTNNVCANWDPAQHGYLNASKDGIIDFYLALDPVDRGAEFPNNTRYIYTNLDLVNLYNSSPNQAAKITKSDQLGFLVDGQVVGVQRNRFFTTEDNVCLLDKEGQIQTLRGGGDLMSIGNEADPDAEWTKNKTAKLLSDYQGLQDTYNDVEYYASRFQLLWEPSERWSVLGNFHWGANRGDSFHQQAVAARTRNIAVEEGEIITEAPGYFTGTGNASSFQETGPPGPTRAPFEARKLRDGLVGNFEGSTPGFAGDDVFSGFYSTDGKEKLDLWGVILEATYEPEWGRILYVGGYEFNSRDILDEGGACPCTDLEANIDDETWQITNDIRVQGEAYGLEWSLGFFQIHEELESNNNYPSSLRLEIDQAYTQTLDAFNLGNDFHYDFLEDGALRWLYQISFDGGWRYNWEHKEFSLAAEFFDVFRDTVRTSIPKETVDGSWNGATGEATLSILPVENARFYFKFTRGSKAGHFNAGLTVQPKPVGAGAGNVVLQSLDPVAPESVYAAEVGLKSSWFDGRLELGGAFFRYWYKDLQVFDIVNEFGDIPTQQLLNADANVMGAEAELSIRPLDGLLLQVSMGWLDATFGEFIVEKRSVAGNGNAGTPGIFSLFNYEDNPLIAAPQWSVSGYAEYELPLYRWGSLIPSFNFSYKSRSYFDAQKEEMISQEPFWLFNARLAYRTPGGAIEVAGWVKNFLNTEYKIDAFDLAREFNQINEVWAEPRTFGITISYSF